MNRLKLIDGTWCEIISSSDPEYDTWMELFNSNCIPLPYTIEATAEYIIENQKALGRILIAD